MSVNGSCRHFIYLLLTLVDLEKGKTSMSHALENDGENTNECCVAFAFVRKFEVLGEGASERMIIIQ